MILERIRELLTTHELPFCELHHPPTRTSRDSARERGEPLEIGGKALLIKVDDRFALFVLSAARRLDSKALRRSVGARKSRFATPEELAALTGGLVPGSVPPFGEPILPFPLIADASVLANARIAFNAGSLTDSIVLATADWAKVARPRVLEFTTTP
ncbi:hypothetical protein PPSIR1_13043 [Plesiocystis pacifica SIR-1]|uniref:YbaK/aminoacyl-tRNA synthetase-associated domain-containing protein n=1 Tax=Plesiocystis pacifica SIR-1 TaxID=391625 RepID=A6G0B3_9BACT|nr:YbaK/EbsC family protein [Plesiocystis pacifica]EDM80810.1 hypothetical protein PPSIR1_13043 [Plesiocystis pacifica SIR-1]